ncbi:MAG: UDP-2,4-diacetamido-2,4,6-trideoxy-beta-L-altropyranose hydrolase [Roseburia sp.]|nr:UDP-2,4-diacetamido-2,4,6-trideoxy-beta-L-altropyranose hydrolase [Roseburia sp.]
MAGTFIFRADGNAEIGAGHLMRCLTIASALRERLCTDEGICFVCADEGSGHFVRQRGFRVLLTGTDYRLMETELSFWEGFAEGMEAPRCILIDSYYVTKDYIMALKQYGRTALLEDKGERALPVELLINYHIYADRELYDKLYRGQAVRLCLGAGYVPLREEFRKASYQIRDCVKDVLITTGGGDKDNIGGAVLKELISSASGITWHLVVGSFHPHLEELRQMEAQLSNVVIEQDVQHMAELMTKCDICVSAGGTTLYELAALGVPFICFSYAENQETLTEYIGAHDIAGFAGAWHRDEGETLGNIRGFFLELLASLEKRSRYHKNERALIDGQGAGRIAKALAEELAKETAGKQINGKSDKADGK